MYNISVALGNKKADLVLKNATYLNVFTKEWEKGDIAISNGYIAGVGGEYFGEKEIDVSQKCVVPSYVDAHVHIESSKLSPTEFAKIILPHGVTTVIADPHEIANVKGIDGVEYICKGAKDLPLDIKVMAPSCVPATNFENSGANLDSTAIEKLLKNKYVLGLGELMNSVGVIYQDQNVLAKVQKAHNVGKIIDGHAPSLTNKQLNAYVGSGVKTDHECETPSECLEKVAKGMYVHLRQGSQTKNMLLNSTAVNQNNYSRFILCTDDKTAEDLLNEGSIDYSVKLLVQNGMDEKTALIMASYNACVCYGLKNKGAIAPGYIADLNIIDNVKDLNVESVIKQGNVISENGKLLIKVKNVNAKKVKNSVNIKPVTLNDLQIKIKGDKAKVIVVQPGTVVTKSAIRQVKKQNDIVNASQSGLLKVAVIERHNATGNIGLALLDGYGKIDGAIASTIAHDSHNLIVVGSNDNDMLIAINKIIENQGGLVVVGKGKVISSLPLEIAGLMTSSPYKSFVKKYAKLRKDAWALGVDKKLEPILSLAFLALPVIPELKLTDLGLFDVVKFSLVPIDE